MAALIVLKNTYVNSVRGAIRANLQLYRRDQSWLSEVAGRSQWQIPTSLELKAPLDLLAPEAADLKDFENAIRLHKALPNLTPLQGRDPRLWVRLTHVELWQYMRMRWPVERHMGDIEKAVRYIDSRYFVPQSQSRSLLRNGVARLWWIARLSHDPARENPYELTRVLLSTLDITQQILERGLGRAPVVLRGFLEFLLRNESTLLAGGDANRLRIRRLAKYLNMQGGVCILDCLTQADVVSLLDAELMRLAELEHSEEQALLAAGETADAV